jgi:hypothetical protein
VLTECRDPVLQDLRAYLSAKMHDATQSGNNGGRGKKMVQYVQRIMIRLLRLEHGLYKGSVDRPEHYAWACLDWLRLFNLHGPGGSEALQLAAMRSNKATDASQYQQTEEWYHALEQVTVWYFSECSGQVSERLNDARVVKAMHLSAVQAKTVRWEFKRLFTLPRDLAPIALAAIH